MLSYVINWQITFSLQDLKAKTLWYTAFYKSSPPAVSLIQLEPRNCYAKRNHGCLKLFLSPPRAHLKKEARWRSIVVNSCLILSITAAQAHLLSFPRYAHALTSLLAGTLTFRLEILRSRGKGLAVLYTQLDDLLWGEDISPKDKNFGNQRNSSAVHLPFRYLKCRVQEKVICRPADLSRQIVIIIQVYKTSGTD